MKIFSILEKIFLKIKSLMCVLKAHINRTLKTNTTSHPKKKKQTQLRPDVGWMSVGILLDANNHNYIALIFYKELFNILLLFSFFWWEYLFDWNSKKVIW